MSVFHLNLRGHTIEECSQLKERICKLIATGKIPHMWSENTVLTYDQLKPNVPVTKHTQFYCNHFTQFKNILVHIYIDLVQNVVLSSIREDDGAFNPIGMEIWKPCPHHDATDQSIGRCLKFLYDMESLINMGKI